MAVSLFVTVAAVAAAAMLYRRQHALRGTTLTAPIRWAIIACASVAALELCTALGLVDGIDRATWEYVAGVLTISPSIAILGAKRPQDKAWQFVVGTLLVVLCLPVALSLALGDPLHVHFLVRWFLIVPAAAVGLLNFLPTRHALKALLAAGGQLCLWWPAFASQSGTHDAAATISPAWLGWQSTWGPSLWQVGAALLALAAIWWAAAARPRAEAIAAGESELDAPWREFRNLFGAVWGLRVQQRFNQTAQQQSWNVLLTWYGLRDSAGKIPLEISPATRDAAAQNLRSLWRRFVDERWEREQREC